MLQYLWFVSIIMTIVADKMTFNLRYHRQTTDGVNFESFQNTSSLFEESQSVVDSMNGKMNCSEAQPGAIRSNNDTDCNVIITMKQIEPTKNKQVIRVLAVVEFEYQQGSVNESKLNPSEILSRLQTIAKNIDKSYKQGSVVITKPVPTTCKREHDKVLGYNWPESEPGAKHSVIYPPSRKSYVIDYASRICTSNGWQPIMLNTWGGVYVECDPHHKDFRHFNALCYPYMIETLRGNIHNVSNKKLEQYLQNLVFAKAKDSNLVMSEAVLSIVDVVMSTNRKVNPVVWWGFRGAVETALEKYPISHGIFRFTSNRTAMTIRDIQNIASKGDTLYIEIGQPPFDRDKHGMDIILDTVKRKGSYDYHKMIVSIKSIMTHSNKSTTVDKIAFYVYKDDTVYPSQNNNVVSPVYSVLVPGMENIPLDKNAIKLIFKYSVVDENSKLSCVFWDTTINVREGGWSKDWCITTPNVDGRVECDCMRLGSFALLVGTRETLKMRASRFQFVSMMASAVSAGLLVLTLITYLVFSHLIAQIPSKILKMICVNLLCTDLIYILNVYMVHVETEYDKKRLTFLCKWIAVVLHYFLLASQAWVGANGYYLYKALTGSAGRKGAVMPNLITFASVIPLFIVIPIVAMDFEANYGLVNREICWLRYGSAIVSFVIPMALITVVNISIFYFVFKHLRRVANSDGSSTIKPISTLFKGGVTLVILLALTWVFAYKADTWGDTIFVYLFITCNSFQALFLFSFFCVYLDHARHNWLRCCRRQLHVVESLKSLPKGIITAETHQGTNKDIQLDESRPITRPITKLRSADSQKSSTSIY